MNGVNKTLYIPLYGKASVSKKGIILKDKKAEEIWEKEKFELKGKAKSRWLTYYMAMRARVFDDWTKKQLQAQPDAVVLHIGCGMDGRVLRIGKGVKCWYDVDFAEVIKERGKYYTENETYHMIEGNAAKPEWIDSLQNASQAIVILEGISMYLMNEEVADLFKALQAKYPHVSIFMDVYTTFGAKASKYKNPINDVGVTTVYGIDDPKLVLGESNIQFIAEHTMTPAYMVEELKGFEYAFFKLMFAGRATGKIYRLFEYQTRK